MPQTSNSSSSFIFTFLRHGESTGNAENRHQGQADFPLTKLGITQVKILADYWKKQEIEFDRAFSSPLTRAKQSAEIITKALNLTLDYDPIWMERDNGKLAGMLHEKAMQEMPPPDFIPLYQPIASTGESQWELFLRAGRALNLLMKNPPGKYLIISHGGAAQHGDPCCSWTYPAAKFPGP